MNDRHHARELAGPFIVLGVDKDADEAAINNHFHLQCLAAARGELQWTQGDLEWARQLLHDSKRRLVADLDSVNADLASGEVNRLSRVYHLDRSTPGWEPLDPEPPMALPDTADFDPQAMVDGIAKTDIPVELPVIDAWLQKFAGAVTDPWTMELSGN